tara:strand:+ start:618 stop:1364 length:747 start_codon:yes stop_codon:yes gene_type:complete
MTIVEDLGDGNWLIKPTGEIRSCSRSTAYRLAKKAEALAEAEPKGDDSIPDTNFLQPAEIETTVIADDWPEEDEWEPDAITADVPLYDLPTLEDVEEDQGGDGGDPESFQDQSDYDHNFIDAIKGAEIIEDSEGNKSVHISDLFIGDSSLITSMFGAIDSSLSSIAQNRYGVTLWDEGSRSVQRTFFVRLLGTIAPRTSLTINPNVLIAIMIGWLYGVPSLKILRAAAKRKKAEQVENPYEDQGVSLV